jgi:hypothetical protein
MVFRSLASKYGGSAAAAAPAAPSPQGATPATPQAVKPSRPSEETPRPQPRPPADTPPQPRRPGSITIPPLAKASAPAEDDELLESLELQPEGEEEELSLEGVSTDPALGGAEEEEVIDADQLGGMEEIQEFPLEEPAVATSTLPPPARIDKRTTLISPPEEAEELRSRIRHPREPELQLDEIEDEEEIESISLDEPPAAAASAPAPPRPAAPARVLGEAASISTDPISLELTAVPGRTDVSIPVELRLGNGTARVLINLTLTLNVKQD